MKEEQKPDNKEQNENDKVKKDGFYEEDPTKILSKKPPVEYATTFYYFIKRTFDFNDGKTNIPKTIKAIKEDIVFQGYNVWILICSIVVASVGLNINSTAVIIGAMLISPLMGPIRGVGLGIGIYDFKLMINSLKNFGVATGSSILTSFIYFLISPLGEETSELLGRTTPTFLDVIIAFFGGLAGIISGVRGGTGSTVVPGVAIATALMPPLCTAGYGLAIGNFGYFIGAFYLFLLNSLFICLSTILVVRFLKFPYKEYLNPKVERKVRWMTTGFLLVMIVPSVFLLVGIIKESNFNANAKLFEEKVIAKTDVDFRYKMTHTYDSEFSKIEIDITNGYITEDIQKSWKSQLSNYGLGENVIFKVYQDEDIDSRLKKFKEEIASNTGGSDVQYFIKQKEEQLQTLEEKYAFYKDLYESLVKKEISIDRLSKNFEIDYPQIQKFSLLRGLESDFSKTDTIYTVLVKWKPNVSREKRDSLNSLIAKKVKIELELTNHINSKQINVISY